MVNPLVDTSELEGFPGAPFDQSVVDAVVAQLVGEAGWHIAPIMTDTVIVDTDGGRHLFLPTMFLTGVVEVRDVSGDEPLVLTGWRKSRSGILFRAAGWPCGFETVEVDMTHGYNQCPPDLLPVIADMAMMATLDKTVRQESAQPFQVMRTDLTDLAAWSPGSGALARYKIPPRP